MPTRHQATKHTYWVQIFGNQVPKISDVEQYLKDAQTNSVQTGPGTFANELTRFPFEAKPSWEKIRKHGKHAVICKMCL